MYFLLNLRKNISCSACFRIRISSFSSQYSSQFQIDYDFLTNKKLKHSPLITWDLIPSYQETL